MQYSLLPSLILETLQNAQDKYHGASNFMSIKLDNHTDPFTYHVYESIEPSVRATFTPRQVHAIETAIRANKPFQKHPVDIRGAFPLFFFRAYFVILMGRDKRQPTRD